MTSSHHDTRAWSAFWDVNVQTTRWKDRLPTEYKDSVPSKEENLLHLTLGAQATFVLTASRYAKDEVPKDLLAGIGEYHGLSAFQAPEDALEYAGETPIVGTMIGTIWGNALGFLPDGPNHRPAVRVAVCAWGELLSIEDFATLHTR